MPDPRLTLCTYTHNDAAFVHDLLSQVDSWQITPDEIVVVDDGSGQPFKPLSARPGLRVLRLEPNQGIAAAKGAGLSAARGAAILSLDCDTRVAPDWLSVNLPNLARPGVALVGGALAHADSGDLVSRYLRTFGDLHAMHHVGEVDFVPGNAFLLSRSTWNEVGGFPAPGADTCEDHLLSRLLRARGHTLYSDAAAKAWQLRTIRRTTLCRRVWSWCGDGLTGQMPGEGNCVNYLFEVAVQPMLERFGTSIELGELLFLYVDLLYMTHTVLGCLAHGQACGLTTDQLRAGFARRLAKLFDGYPRLWTRFRADLAEIGHPVLMPAAGDEDAWTDFFLFNDLLRNGGLFDWLEHSGMDQLRLEDREEHARFPYCAQAAHAPMQGNC